MPFKKFRQNHSVGVIGAGIAGLSAASALRDAGIEAVVFDKARGPGGRTSTRRDGESRFDHGAQYLTCRSDEFERQLRQWLDDGVVQPWHARVVEIGTDGARRQSSHRRYVGVPGMNAMTKSLAAELRCEYRTRVVGLRHCDRWELETESGDRHRFEHLIVTAPPLQTIALIDAVGTPLVETLQTVAMAPCWALLLAFPEPVEAGFDAAYVNDGGPIAWCACDSSKPGRRPQHCWVVHAGRNWSVAHLEDDKIQVEVSLLAAFQQLLGTDIAPTRLLAHRWRYSRAIRALDDLVLHDPARKLLIAGDWCAGSRVEGAFLSGRAAARAIVARSDARTL